MNHSSKKNTTFEDTNFSMIIFRSGSRELLQKPRYPITKPISEQFPESLPIEVRQHLSFQIIRRLSWSSSATAIPTTHHCPMKKNQKGNCKGQPMRISSYKKPYCGCHQNFGDFFPVESIS
jgi:hypothetical protein